MRRMAAFWGDTERNATSIPIADACITSAALNTGLEYPKDIRQNRQQ